MSHSSSTIAMANGQNPAPAGIFKDELDDFERFALENLVRNEWGLKVTTLNRLMYCGVSVECLEVIEEHDLNDIFNDDRAIGQKILLRHRLREWRKGLHWNSPEQPTPKRRYERHSVDPLDLEKKPRITTSNSLVHEVATPNIILPDTRNLSGIASSSTSTSSSMTPTQVANTAGNVISDAGNLPIQITPEALTAFLQGSRSGRWVLNFYAENHHLDKKALTELTHVVVEPFLVFNITFTHAMMRHYAEVIIQLFPSEQIETFYCPRNTIRKNPTGKLYDRYVNQRLRYKTKFNAQRPTFVPDSQTQRTFAEMSTVGISVMQQQYLDYGTDPREFNRTPTQAESFSEESMNIYGADEGSMGSILIDGN
ncbi:uncharacterized protein LOC135708434 [Ochlerotatus camptorhynchus]|uniref:uncharacterized protein LOC135708434 n=1 Tax=Ochlerotatus camptorhynchus TaxID=644619 RepID=UPI0031DCAAF8